VVRGGKKQGDDRSKGWKRSEIFSSRDRAWPQVIGMEWTERTRGKGKEGEHEQERFLETIA